MDEYVAGGSELLDRCRALWERLKVHQTERSPFFAEAMGRGTWEARRQAYVAKAQLDGALRVDLALRGGVPIGYCITTITAAQIGEIESIYVEPDHRRRGVGRALIEAAFAWLDAEGIQHRMIGVAGGNEEVIPFYRRFGYVPSATLLRHRDSFG